MRKPMREGGVVGALLATILLLPTVAAAQGTARKASPQAPAAQTAADNPSCEGARENLQQARQAVRQARAAYRQAVEQFGRDSEQAHAARRALEQARHRLEAARQRAEHCRRGQSGSEAQADSRQPTDPRALDEADPRTGRRQR